MPFDIGILSKRQESLELFRIDHFELRKPLGMRLLGQCRLHLFSSDAEFANFSIYGIPSLETLAEKLRECQLGNAAINRSLAALRRMLRIAKREKKIHDVPYIEFQKEPPARKGFVELADFERLIRLLPTHLRPLVTFLYYCGTRIGEALQITWEQVDLNARLIRLEPEQTKTDEARILPLPPVLIQMLREAEPQSGRVFDATNLRKEWNKACVTAGLGTKIEVPGKPYDPRYDGLTLHDLRRSAVRNLINAGVSERVAMKITGHKTRSVFDRYHIVSTDDVTNAMQAVVTASLNSPAAKRSPRSEILVKSGSKKRLATSVNR